MPIEILMPALSPTMTEGTLAKWVKKEGDTVESGDVLCEIETDKATMEVEAVDEGTIGKILIGDSSEGVAVNQAIALLLEEDEDASSLDGYEVAAAPTPAAEATPEAPKEDNVVEMPKPGAAPTPAPAAAPAASAPAPLPIATPAPTGGRVFASPLARRMADDAGINVAMVPGSGPAGRVVKHDVEKALVSGIAHASGSAMGAVVRHPDAYSEIPNSGMRKTIAKRLTESKQQVPHFYLNMDVELDALLDARRQINAGGAPLAEGQPAQWKVSVNDMVVKAVGMAMRDIPAANASWTEAAIQQYTNVDVSVAVAIDGGLITPIVQNADQQSIVNISHITKDLITRAKEGKLAPEEYQGGGFSISNLGMYGIKSFNAIVNPPQGCILAVGAGEQRTMVKKGDITIVNAMSVTLSCDHRVVDGAVGAEFLNAFKKYIENPVMMMV